MVQHLRFRRSLEPATWRLRGARRHEKWRGVSSGADGQRKVSSLLLSAIPLCRTVEIRLTVLEAGGRSFEPLEQRAQVTDATVHWGSSHCKPSCRQYLLYQFE